MWSTVRQPMQVNDLVARATLVVAPSSLVVTDVKLATGCPAWSCCWWDCS